MSLIAVLTSLYLLLHKQFTRPDFWRVHVPMYPTSLRPWTQTQQLIILYPPPPPPPHHHHHHPHRCRRIVTVIRGVYPPNNQGAILSPSLPSPFPPLSPSPFPTAPPLVFPSPPLVLSSSSIPVLLQSGPLKPARRSGESCNLPSGIWGQRHSRPRFLVYSEKEKFIWQKCLYGFLYTENSIL